MIAERTIAPYREDERKVGRRRVRMYVSACTSVVSQLLPRHGTLKSPARENQLDSTEQWTPLEFFRNFSFTTILPELHFSTSLTSPPQVSRFIDRSIYLQGNVFIQGMWNGGRNLIFFFATLAKLEKLHNAILFFNLISIDNVSPSVYIFIRMFIALKRATEKFSILRIPRKG